MSWVSHKSTIKTLLTDEGYTNIPYNFTIDDLPESKKHKAFSITPMADITEVSAGNIVATGGKLIIYYRVNSDNEFDSNYDIFISAVIKILQSGYSLLSTPEYNRAEDDDKLAIGSVEFNIETQVS